MKSWEEGSNQEAKWKPLGMCLMNVSLKIWVLWEGSTHGIGGQEGVPLFGKDLIVQLLQQIS